MKSGLLVKEEKSSCSLGRLTDTNWQPAFWLRACHTGKHVKKAAAGKKEQAEGSLPIGLRALHGREKWRGQWSPACELGGHRRGWCKETHSSRAYRGESLFPCPPTVRERAGTQEALLCVVSHPRPTLCIPLFLSEPSLTSWSWLEHLPPLCRR